MKRSFLAGLGFGCLFLGSCARETEQSVVVVIDGKASRLERLAASELRRYIYLRLGELPAIKVDGGSRAAAELDPQPDALIVVSTKDRPLLESFRRSARQENHSLIVEGSSPFTIFRKALIGGI